jgi:hypothetical protein
MRKNENRNYQPIIPYSLQFFAEEQDSSVDNNTPPENEVSSTETGNNDVKDTSTETIDYQAKYVESEARNKKLKADLDNSLKKLGEMTKTLRAKMSEAELQAEQKAAEDEEKAAHVKELEDYKAQNEALKRYRIQGMDEELAAKAAKAEIEGDMDELANIQAQHTKALLKEKEAEWKASRPKAQMGDGEDSNMTKEEIFAIKDPKERQIAIAKNLKTFENH